MSNNVAWMNLIGFGLNNVCGDLLSSSEDVVQEFNGLFGKI